MGSLELASIKITVSHATHSDTLVIHVADTGVYYPDSFSPVASQTSASGFLLERRGT